MKKYWLTFAFLSSLNRVKRFVKVNGMVNATPTDTQHSQVINGFSDLMIKVFGEAGRHARAAVGMSSLPLGAHITSVAASPAALRK